MADLENHISDDGILFICGFGHKHKVECKIRADDLIQPADLEHLSRPFNLIRHIENEDDRGFFVTYIFRKEKGMK